METILTEKSIGYVSYIGEKSIYVKLDGTEEEVEYSKELLNCKDIKRGDMIIVEVNISHRTRDEKGLANGIKHYLTKEEMEKLDKDWDNPENSVTGDLIL